MMGLGIVFGALAGAGSALQSVGAQQMQQANALNMAQVQADLQQQKQEALIDYQNVAADRQREQRAARINDAAQTFMDQAKLDNYNAQQQENASTMLNGSGTGTDSPGFSGISVQDALAQINKMQGPDKDAALAQVQQQIASQQAAFKPATMADVQSGNVDFSDPSLQPSDYQKANAYVMGAVQTGDAGPNEIAQMAASRAQLELKTQMMQSQLGQRQEALDMKQAMNNVYSTFLAQRGDAQEARAALDEVKSRIEQNGGSNSTFAHQVAAGADYTKSLESDITAMQRAIDPASGYIHETVNGKPNPEYAQAKAKIAEQQQQLRAAQTMLSKFATGGVPLQAPGAALPPPTSATPPANSAAPQSNRPPLASFVIN